MMDLEIKKLFISQVINYDRVIKSAKIVDVDKKITSLKDKYETMLTRDLEDDGIELSGGESQKLSIARAIYKNAPLYILDEPTSALDPLAEAKIYQNFNEVVGGNSVIYIENLTFHIPVQYCSSQHWTFTTRHIHN